MSISEQRKVALKAIYEQGWGYVTDLQCKIGMDLFLGIRFCRIHQVWLYSHIPNMEHI